MEVSAVLHLKASDLDVLTDRIAERAVESKREDDADTEVIHRRFRVYEEQSMPVLACYIAPRSMNLMPCVRWTKSPIESTASSTRFATAFSPMH